MTPPLALTFVNDSITVPISAGNLNAICAAVNDKLEAFLPQKYGAVGNGTTDDTAAIQDAINAAQTAGGGMVHLGGFRYAIAGNLSITNGNLVHLDGSGAGVNDNGTFQIAGLVRTSGTGPILTVSGTPFASSPGASVIISNLSLMSPTVGGDLLFLDCVGEARISGVTLANTTGTALHMTAVMNSTVDHLTVFACGNGTTKPAILLDAATGVGSTGGCSTVKFTNTALFGCTGTEIRLTGSSGDSAPTDCITFMSFHIERVAQTVNFPAIDLGYTQSAKFIGGRVRTDGASDPSKLLTQTGSAYTAFLGVQFDWAATLGYAVDQISGDMTMLGCTFLGAATGAQYHIGSGAGIAKASSLVFAYVPAGTTRILDERVTATKLGQKAVDVVRVSGNATASNIGSMPSWAFADAATSNILGAVTVPERVISGHVVFRLTWTLSGGGSGSVAWSIGTQYNSVAAGWSWASSGPTWPASTTGYPLPASAEIQVTNISTNSSSPTLNPGEVLGVSCSRIGADGADTATDTAELVVLSVIFDVEP